MIPQVLSTHAARAVQVAGIGSHAGDESHGRVSWAHRHSDSIRIASSA